MFRRFCSVALLSLIGISLFAEAPSPRTVSDPALSPAINEAVLGILEQRKAAGSVVLVAQAGKIRHLVPSGQRSLASGERMTADTVFRIHSFTKAIVSAAALQLFEKGHYEFDDPISKWIPAFAEMQVMLSDGTVEAAANPITVADLLRHTSGLGYDFSVRPEIGQLYHDANLWSGSLADFCERLASVPLPHGPGEGWTYGVSTDVLGRLIEIWSGQNLDQYLSENFFVPLGMVDTGFTLSAAQQARFAGVHQTTLKGLAPGRDPLGRDYGERPTLLSGGGGLVSTARDYYAFLDMIVKDGERNGRRYLEENTVALMKTNQLPSTIEEISFREEKRFRVGFGFGFSVAEGPHPKWDKDAAEGEYGWGGAASCHYWISESDDDLIVITLEQTVPYNWNHERVLKPVIYSAVR
ncbi:MAG: serine hydrolase domain-containing protein [Verrucomicrobiota bacterium]